MRKLWAAVAVVVTMGCSQGQAWGDSGEPLVTVGVAADVGSISAGQRFHLVFTFSISPGWHIYWKDPGETGVPTSVKVEAPAGFTVGDIRWPRPEVLDEGGLFSYAYEGSAALFVPVTAPAEVTDGEVRFEALVRWLVCKEVCITGKADETITVKTGAAEPREEKAAEALRRQGELLPEALEAAEGGSVSFGDGKLVLRGPAGDHEKIQFLRVDHPGVVFREAEASIADGRFKVVVPITLEPENSLGQPPLLGGLVTLGEHSDDPAYEFQLSIEE